MSKLATSACSRTHVASKSDVFLIRQAKWETNRAAAQWVYRTGNCRAEKPILDLCASHATIVDIGVKLTLGLHVRH